MSELVLFIRHLLLSSESYSYHVSVHSNFIYKAYIYHSVDGKQVIGHLVLKVVVGESEEEVLHAFKDMTISQYQ